MSTIGVHADLEGTQKKWIIGALALALVLHVICAWAMGWYKIPGLLLPSEITPPAGPFTVRQIEINPDALKSPQADPIANLPVAEATQNPAQFNLDPNLVEKALLTPQPAVTTPAVPDASRVIASTDLTPSVPFVETDTATMTAEIARIDPASTSPVTTKNLAQDLISAQPGQTQAGMPAGAPATGNGTGAGKLPGFAELAPAFHPPNASLAHLPEPILLRLPSDVLFDFDSGTLKPEADSLLSHAIALITKYPEADVRIDGYSDSFGRADYNLTLSQQRAEAVQAWLQEHVKQPTYKFHSQGHGSANYVVSPQKTIEQQQPNRRVEIVIQALKP